MPDAYYVAAWHRYVQWRGQGRDALGGADAGLSLIEILVAIIILSVGLIGLAGVLGTDIKQQKVENSQVIANHLADSWFAYEEAQTRPAPTTSEVPAGGNSSTTGASAVSASYAAISAAPTNPTPIVSGVTYHETWTALICPAGALTVVKTTSQAVENTFNASQCTSGGTPTPSGTVLGTLKLTWAVGDTSHTLSVTRNLADNTTYVPGATQGGASNPLANCTIAGTVASDTLGSTPTTSATYNSSTKVWTDNPSVDLDTSEHPQYYTSSGAYTAVSVATGGSWVTFNLSEAGLENTLYPNPPTYPASSPPPANWGSPSCIPLVWTDTTGTHQVDMHLTSTSGCTPSATNSCSYTADVPLSEITDTAPSAPHWDNAVVFSALFEGTTVANSTSYVSYNFGLDSRPIIPTGGCTVPAAIDGAGVILGLGTPVGELTAAITVTCSAQNLNSNSSLGPLDTITATYPATSTTNGSITLSYSSSSGKWQGTLPAKSQLYENGGLLTTNTWTFTTSRQGDGKPLSNPAAPLTPVTATGTVVQV